MSNFSENKFEPAISVIVPIYNVEKYIERCLKSLFTQTIANKCEFIFVNDCTPDSSMQIVEKVILQFVNLRNQVCIINHAENKGSATARKTGMLVAHGKYVIQIDSDDWCEPNMLEMLHTQAELTESDIVNCDLFFEYKKKTVLKRENPGKIGKETVRKLLNGTYDGFLHVKLVRRELYLRYLILPVDDINMWEDVLLSVRLYFYAQKISYISMPLYHYEKSNTNSICAVFSDKSKKDLCEVIDNIQGFLAEVGALSSFNDEFLQLKARIMSIVLMSDNNLFSSQVKIMYPEIVSIILHVKSIPIYNRICLFFLYRKHIFLANIVKIFVISGRILRSKLRG